MKKDYICVFDCETIPDVAALVRVLDEDAIAGCFEPFDKKSFAKLLDAQLSQKIGGEKQSAPLNFAVNSAEQNFKIENSEQNSASQRKTADPRSPLNAAEAAQQIRSLHALVRERLDFGFFAAHASRMQTLMMVLFYASPALLRLFYKIYRKLK